MFVLHGLSSWTTVVVADEALLGSTHQLELKSLTLYRSPARYGYFVYFSDLFAATGHIADKILILYRGKMIVFDKTDIVLGDDQQPYVHQLLHDHLNKQIKFKSDKSKKIAD